MKIRGEKVRVAVFTDQFYQKNGVCHFYRNLVAYAERNRLRLDLYCFAETEGVEKRGRVSIHRFRRTLAIPFYENLAFDFGPNLSLLQALLRIKCHVVHVAAPDTLGWNAVTMARLLKRPVVGVYHTSIPQYVSQMYFKSPTLDPLVQSLTWGVMRAFYDKCHLTLATTDGMQSQLQKNGITVPVEILRRGVDAVLFHPEKRTIPRPAQTPTILYAGRLSLEKNLYFLAETLNRLRAADVPFNAAFAGEGPLRAELQTMLPWATFHGFLHGENLARAYANADIFAFPSRTDTFGNVVLEAMASGLPALVADECGPGEIVTEGETGFVAPDPTAFTARLTQLIQQPGLRSAMGYAARKAAQEQTWDAIFDQLWARYAHLSAQNAHLKEKSVGKAKAGRANKEKSGAKKVKIA